MKISIVAETECHEIRFFEFLTPYGRTVTSFFQVVEKPNIGIGCYAEYSDALDIMCNPPAKEKSYIETTYLLFHKKVTLDFSAN